MAKNCPIVDVKNLHFKAITDEIKADQTSYGECEDFFEGFQGWQEKILTEIRKLGLEFFFTVKVGTCCLLDFLSS